MTQQEFDNTRFYADTKAIYKGEVREVVALDFDERLLGLKNEMHPDERDWVRCENVELVAA